MGLQALWARDAQMALRHFKRSLEEELKPVERQLLEEYSERADAELQRQIKVKTEHAESVKTLLHSPTQCVDMRSSGNTSVASIAGQILTGVLDHERSRNDGTDRCAMYWIAGSGPESCTDLYPWCTMVLVLTGACMRSNTAPLCHRLC